MPLDHKPIEELTCDDLLSLLDNDVRESRSIEYKRELPGGTDREKKEFLADISSFANAGGGYVLFGVDEDDGVPVAFPGVGSVEIDSEVLRLEGIVKDGLDPRLPAIRFQAVKVSTNSSTLIAHVPKSFRAPHMVRYGGSSRFYSRHSGGKYQMDATELRQAFVRSEFFADRVRRFRADRLSLWGGSARSLGPETPTVILHLVPDSFLDVGASLTLSNVPEAQLRRVAAPWAQGVQLKHNVDGVLVANFERKTGIQFFRNGIVEAISQEIFQILPKSGSDSKEFKWLDADELQRMIVETVEAGLSFQNQMECSFPVRVALSLIGVGDVRLTSMEGYAGWFDRGRFLFSDVAVERHELPARELLHPLLEQIWNAVGHECVPRTATGGFGR